jgi:class 3 adenylate cyclase/tetratricopeptide (TPR) repeat protein
MTFDEVLAQVLELLQREQRVSYRALKRRFDLDDDYLEDIKDELIYAKKLAMDEDNRVLVWTGDQATSPPPPVPSTSEPSAHAAPDHEREPLSYTPKHLAEKILTSRSALEGERKQVTVLFCDLANSTPIAERLGPEHMHTLLNRFFELALQEVHRYEGTINQFLGDGFMALFGAPIAHEDHARRGVLSALALQRTLKEADLGRPYGVECAFRMGLNSGLVVVGSIGDNLRMDYSAIGDITNLASRLQQLAEPGTILVSERTSRLVQGAVRLEALTPVEVKGKTEPVSIYKVVGTLPRRSPIVSRSERTLSQFVGRERELATLEALFTQVEAGQGQVVGIVGEAGGGKSRLLYEFRQRLQDKRVTYLEGRCLSYGSSIPYHPLIDVLRHNCGISETESPATIIEKVRLALQEVGMDPEESAPYLLQLLGVKEGTESLAVLTPEAIRTRTFETLKQMSLQGSQQRPLIFEIEDVHWIDKTSEAYLASLVESLAGTAILLLTTYRPGYRPPWIDKSYATQLSLRSLTPQDSVTVVHSTSHHAALPASLEHRIIEQAEGNPFFLEELTRAVIEQGALPTDVVVPDTIQGVLSARIDRLPEAHKRLLQTASVLGREFSPRLLAAMWEGSGLLESLLLELKRLEFLFERTGADEPLYVFKHALTQEVAYASLLTGHRQALHAAAGQALEALYTDRLDEVYDRLAYHYAHTDQATKAVAYLTLVATKAARQYAHAEAITSFQEALRHAEQLSGEQRDHQVLDLVIRQCESLFWSGRWQDLVALFLQHQDRLERLQTPVLAGRYYYRLALTYAFLGQRGDAAQSIQRALEAGQGAQDAPTLGMAHFVMGFAEQFAGRFHQGVAHAQRAVALLEGSANPIQRGNAFYLLGFLYGFLGHFPAALAATREMGVIGRASGDRRLQSQAAALGGWISARYGAWQEGLAACQHGLEDAPDAFETALNLGFLGAVYLEQGEGTQALPVLESAVQAATQYCSQLVQSWFKVLLGEAYRMHHQLEQAQRLAVQGYELARRNTLPWGIGAAQRTLGRIAHTSGNLVGAALHLQDAIASFAAMEARYDLARTHLDLASLAHDQGDQDTATTHLSTAYAWFKKLQVPKWVEQTAHLAREYDVRLTEVVLESEGDL